MDALDQPLAGFQLALLPDVKAYWLENPGRTPEQEVVQTIRKTVLPAQHFEERKIHTPEQKPKRRHRSPGKASGWIETREGNTRRKHSNTSYYYCYYQWEGNERRKRKIYIPNHSISHVRSLIEAGTTVDSIIQFLNGSKRQKLIP